jgi:hypothetical protein
MRQVLVDIVGAVNMARRCLERGVGGQPQNDPVLPDDAFGDHGPHFLGHRRAGHDAGDAHP